jgi:O-antigen/teichoic acid export membrane protein
MTDDPGVPDPAGESLDPPSSPITGSSVAALTVGGLAVNLLLKARGLVVVPLYARLLDPDGLGVVTLGTAVATLIAPALHLGLPVGTLVELPHRPAGGAVTRGVRAVLALVAAASMAVIAVAPWAAHRGPWPSLAPLVPHALVVALLAAGMALREASQVVPQLHRQVRFLSVISIVVDYGGAAVGLVLVVVGVGPGGLLWGLAAMTVVGAVASLDRTRRLCPPAGGMDWGFVRAALGVGLPMALIATAQWVVQSADRFFLVHYQGPAAVGVYSLGYSVASAVLALAATLNLVFLPVAAALLRSAPDRLVRLLEECVRLAVAVLGMCVAGAFVLGRPVMRWLGGPPYAAAGEVLPWMVTGYALFTLVQLLQWVPMAVSRRVRAVVAVHAVTAVSNLALDATLVPGMGMHGAVAAAVGAYALGAVLMALIARRALPGWRWRSAVPALVLAAAGAVAGSMARLPGSAGMADMAAAGVAVVVLYAGLGLVVRAVRDEDFALLRSALETGARRLRS